MPPRRPPPRSPKRKRQRAEKPRLTVRQVLEWADSFHRRTGCWPKKDSGRIPLTNETWCGIHQALSKGCRGFSAGSTLAKLLSEHRGVRNRMDLPILKEKEIVLWAKAHFQRTGEWPTVNSGIHGLPRETWYAVNAALFRGTRGLPGGTSLTRLLASQGLKRNRLTPPALSVNQILQWADAYYARHGRWPTINSGSFEGSIKGNNENWSGINKALRLGKRGLAGSSSLAKLLLRHRGVTNPRHVPDLNESEIVRWAKAHFRRTGKWPTANTGPINEAPGESWSAVVAACKHGGRGLPTGSSLARLLDAHGLKRNHRALPPLSIQQILKWARRFHARHGEWPDKNSGAIDACPAETWMAVDAGLVSGGRGLPGGSSLSKLFRELG